MSADGGGSCEGCWLWLRHGSCAYGDACKFVHNSALAGSLAAQAKGMRGGSGGGRPRARQANANKASALRRWVLDTFGAGSPALGGVVLDVAGGRGDLAFELRNLNGVDCVTVDPRPQSVAKVSKKFQDGWFHRNITNRPWITRARPEQPEAPRHLRVFWLPELWRGSSAQRRAAVAQSARVSVELCGDGLPPGKGGGGGEGGWGHAALPANALAAARLSTAPGGAAPLPAPHQAPGAGEGGDALYDELASCLERCTLVLGLHPDEATDWIVDFAIEKGLPFAVVPCCVHARAFPDRRLPKGGEVRSVEDLVAWLVARGEAAGREVLTHALPFEGQNTIVYSLPPGSVHECR